MIKNLKPGFIVASGMAAMIISCSIVLWSMFWAMPTPESPKDYALVTRVIGYTGLALLVIATWLTTGVLGRTIIRQEQQLMGSQR